MPNNSASNIIGLLMLLGLMLVPIVLFVASLWLLIIRMKRDKRASLAFWILLAATMVFGYISLPTIAYLVGCNGGRSCAGL